MPTGKVCAIHIAPKPKAPMVSVHEVHAVPGRGLEGDRHFAPADAAGQNPDEEIALIESEALENLRQQHGLDLTDGKSRRNITTRGVSLNGLVGLRRLMAKA